MRQELDPVLEALIAERKEQDRRAAQARDDNEYEQARAELASLEAEKERDLPAAAAHVAGLRAARDRAEQEYFAAAATLENGQSGWMWRRVQLTDILNRTMPAPWRTARAELEARIAEEQARVIGDPSVWPVHDRHVRGLQTARDQFDALIGTPPATMAARIAEILAAVPPRYEGGPVAHKSYAEEQAELIRAGIMERFRNAINY